MFHVPERFRLQMGPMQSSPADGNNGAFTVRSIKLPRPLHVIATDNGGWEHVSVSLPDRTPTWEEMCHVKDLFWDDEDTVIQFHPPKSRYVNLHAHCLHLWRSKWADPEVPYSILLGPLQQK